MGETERMLGVQTWSCKPMSTRPSFYWAKCWPIQTHASEFFLNNLFFRF